MHSTYFAHCVLSHYIPVLVIFEMISIRISNDYLYSISRDLIYHARMNQFAWRDFQFFFFLAHRCKSFARYKSNLRIVYIRLIEFIQLMHVETDRRKQQYEF